MMKVQGPDTDHLIEQASRGDSSAQQQLLARHRARLRKMVAVRLDRRIAGRADLKSPLVRHMLRAQLVDATLAHGR